ncbi:hypothetical protein LOTGIDRAFT_155133 [Lottia gigantea]|uniref:Major facilitator superfamily (MFS) profile domain-containing protein n=1 Tax=Lottia gigantea TaxID=225164 RepID=V3ZMU9_LOTGI|nr:hypothetical protein LOTGIDRAFT_155133 [Lottia gigantea]ESO85642.1 hypothetical protein LOTGIDRAFT_155133 [Lottia gigantea]
MTITIEDNVDSSESVVDLQNDEDFVTIPDTTMVSDKCSWQDSSTDIPHNSRINMNDFPPLTETFDTSKVPWWTSKRFSLAVLCFFGFLIGEASKSNLSIAIVSMVRSIPKDLQLTNDHHNKQNSTSNITIVIPEADLTDTLFKGGEFDWSKELQGLILGSFFWGYLILQVTAGWMSERFGPKRVIAVGMFTTSAATLLSATTARWSPYLFMGIRIIIGLGQCVLHPCIQSLWMKWSPPKERSSLAGLSLAGGPIGAAVMFPIGGFLCEYGFDGGWPSVFYVIGGVCFLWTVVWCLQGYDCPSQHPSISPIERNYIEDSLGFSRGQELKVKIRINPTPWRSIVSSKPVWAIIVCHFCINYGNYMIGTQLPTYMKEVLKFDIQTNGLYSMLPFLCLWFMMMISGIITDRLIIKDILSLRYTRKMMTSLGTVVPGLFLIGTSYMSQEQQLPAVVMLTIGVGFCGCQISGYYMNTADIAPAFAGILIGISNTIATVPGIIAPFVVGVMTPSGSELEWQRSLYLAGGIYFIAAVVFIIFSDVDIQPWGLVSQEKGLKTLVCFINKIEILVSVCVVFLAIEHHRPIW